MVKQLIYNDKNIADIYIADTFSMRLLGYMFRKHPHYKAILIKPCSSIHTYFMKFDIDVLFLDENMTVIKKIDNLKPGKMIMPIKDCSMVTEAPAGTFEYINTGSKILLQ